MTDVQQLHREAMDLAERAAMAQEDRDTDRSRDLLARAFKLEREAAEQISERYELEPSRSVLLRSAAALALDCGEVREAERLIAKALVGNPPSEIQEELRDLLEQAYFQRHLEVKGVVLEPGEFQMSVTGASVGFGVAESRAFLNRVQDLEKLIFRTAERKAQRPFRERGARSKELTQGLAVYLSVPRAGSFAVTFRLGHSQQTYLPGTDPAESIVSDLVDCLQALASGSPETLEEKIPDQTYRRNFVALAKSVSPDGEAIKSVGLTASVQGVERRVMLSHTIRTSTPSGPRSKGKEAVTVQGTLKYADSTKSNRSEIRLIGEDGTRYAVVVPPGMMDDVVRPHWDAEVKVTGIKKGGKIVLSDIEESRQ